MLIAKSQRTENNEVVVYYKHVLEGHYYVNNIEYLGIKESLKKLEKIMTEGKNRNEE